MNKIVCFDFDGVICDSTEECLITGYNAWLKYRGKNGFTTKAKDIPLDLARYFRIWRGLVRTADQYFVVFNSYTNSQPLESETDFEQRCAQDEPLRNKYKKLFFAAREKLRNQDVQYWSGLNRAYDGIDWGFKKMIEIANVFIVSGGKDRPSVKTFLKQLGIDFPDAKIYDKNTAANKLIALKNITKLTGQKIENIVFLDDNINHLLNLKQGGCRVYMAEWGYHLDEHLKKAEENNIEILNLENWCERIIKIIKNEI